MRDLILHIGRHKTGTTAIQFFLADNRKALQDQGYFVPNSGRVHAAHHQFAKQLSPQQLAALDDEHDLTQLPSIRALERELKAVPRHLKTVVSSEVFQNCRPQAVQSAFRHYSVSVVVYLRNQLEYLASSYAQRVHASNYTGSIEDFYADVHRQSYHYASFLKGWNDQFPGKLVVRRYKGTSVVSDFTAHALGVGEKLFKVRSSRSNPSLNSLVTQFKCELNRRQIAGTPPQEQIYPVLPRLNALFPAAKFALPVSTAKELVALCQASDNEVAAKYFGDSVLFDYSDVPTRETEQLSEAQFAKMHATFLELLEH